jgi:Domain of unknown function (DUF4173)
MDISLGDNVTTELQQPLGPAQPGISIEGGTYLVSVRPKPTVTKFGWTVAVIAAFGFIVCGRTVFAGLAGTLFVFALVGTLIASGTVKRRREPLGWLAAAIAVACALSFRASPWLITLNMLAVITLLFVGTMTAQTGSLFRLTRNNFVEGVFRSLGSWFTGLVLIGSATKWFVSSDRKWRRNTVGSDKATDIAETGTTRSVLRSVLLVAPVLLLVIPLLRAGDAVFSSVFDRIVAFPIDFMSSLSVDTGSIVFGSIGLWVGLALVALAGAPFLEQRVVPANPVHYFVSSSPPLSSKTALSAAAKRARTVRDVSGAAWMLNVVLAIFAAGQIANVFGLAEQLKTEVVSYREIAKAGFFPLLVASAIVLASLVIAHMMLRQERWNKKVIWALQTNVVLTLIVIVVASRRLWVGADIWGLTMLRVLSQSAAILLAIIFGVIAWWQRRVTDRQPIMGVSLAAAVSILLVLNVLPIEGIIVNWNAARPSADNANRFDSETMDPLSRDLGQGFGVAGCYNYSDRWHGKNADAALYLGPIAPRQVAKGDVDEGCARDLLRCDSDYDTSGLRYNWARSQANHQKRKWCSGL